MNNFSHDPKDLEWTIFDRDSILRDRCGPRWDVFETYNREPGKRFNSLAKARQWLALRGFAPNKAGTWTQ
jgi:hypothetical protein